MRQLREAILYETDGSLNLGWLFLIGELLGIYGCIVATLLGHPVPAEGWICLQVCFLATLAASTSQNKAKIANDSTTNTNATDPPNLHTGE